MVLSQASGQRDNYFTINGVRYPAMTGADGAPLPIRTAPDAAFPEAIVLGDPARATDQRTASLVTGDLTGGAGQFRYPAQAGAASLNTYAYGDVDTRWAHAIVQRPNPLAMANTISSVAAGQHYLFAGYAAASILMWTWLQGLYRYDPTGPGWVNAALVANCTGVVRGLGAVFAAGGAAVYRSSDGVTWTALATTGIPASTLYGLARHDNKLYTVAIQGASLNTATVYYSTNFAGAVGAVTWTAGGSFYVDPSSDVLEAVSQLFEWRDRYGRRALFALTQRQILGYDDDANTWALFSDLSPLNIYGASIASTHVWPRDDNLYLAYGADTILRYTGQEIDILGPNLGGGVPAGQQQQLVSLASNTRYLFAAGAGGTTVDSASGGGVWAMNALEGWHRIYRSPTNANIHGCGWGNGKLWTGYLSGGATAVIEQKVPDLSDNPLNATSGARDYDATNTTSLVLAVFAGNAPNVPFQPLSVEIICKKNNARDFGLLSGCTVQVYYRTNNSGGWVALGAALTSANAFPVRRQINGGLGVLCNDFEVRVDLATNSTSQTPVITDIIVHYVQQPLVRAQYTCQLDLRDQNPVFKQEGEGLPGRYFTGTAADLRASLYAVAGMVAGVNPPRAQIVPFSYGAGPLAVGPNAVGVAAALIRIASVEDPLEGYGVVTVAVADLSTAPDG
jgi:hypothetical protein